MRPLQECARGGREIGPRQNTENRKEEALVTKSHKNIACGLLVVLLGVSAARGQAEVAGNPPPSDFPALVVGEESLLGYWSLSGSLDRAKGSLELVAAGGAAVFSPGPLGADQSLDLSQGRYASVTPHADLDAPELTVECFIRMGHAIDGCLFGVRNGRATRFSLHGSSDSSILRLWNGRRVTDWESDWTLEPGKWYHLALSISATETAVWVNGKPCKALDRMGGLNEHATGLPLVLGVIDVVGGNAERSDISIAHLALYGKRMATEAWDARLKALNWSEKKKAHKRENGAKDSEIEARIAKIKQDYGVAVHYHYSKETFLHPAWHSYMKGEQVSPAHATIMLDEIEKFLTVVPKPITSKNLENIYMFKTLLMGGHGTGAMASGRSIYLCSGNAAHIANCLYHEFSHILLVAYPVDMASWMAQLPPGFKYFGNGSEMIDKGINPFEFDDKLRSEGFVLMYSKASLSEDHAVFSDYLFTRKEETKGLMKKYPAMKNRVRELIRYYKSISPDYDFRFYDDVLNPQTS